VSSSEKIKEGEVFKFEGKHKFIYFFFEE